MEEDAVATRTRNRKRQACGPNNNNNNNNRTKTAAAAAAAETPTKKQRSRESKDATKKEEVIKESETKQTTATATTAAKKEKKEPAAAAAPPPPPATDDNVAAWTEILKDPSSTTAQLSQAVVGMRRLLSIERRPPIDRVVDAGAVPPLVQLLTRTEPWSLAFEATWALTNIASDNRSGVLIEAGILPKLMHLLRHHQPDLQEQASWCLGNMTNGSAHYRDLILQAGALPLMLSNLQNYSNNKSLSMLRNVAWAASNICSGEPKPNLSHTHVIIAPYCKLLCQTDNNVDEEFFTDVARGLALVTANDDDSTIQQVIDGGVLPIFVAKLKTSHDQYLCIQILRCLGNITAGNHAQTQSALDANLLPQLELTLQSPKKPIRISTCQILSNIAAGTPNQVEQLLKHCKIISAIIDHFRDDTYLCKEEEKGNEEETEAANVLSNILAAGADFNLDRIINVIKDDKTDKSNKTKTPAKDVIQAKIIPKNDAVGKRKLLVQ